MVEIGPVSWEDARPRIRADAVVSQVDAFSYQLENPETGATLQLDSTGYLVAEQFESGDRTVAEVAKTLEEAHQLRVPLDQIRLFLFKANELGLLEQPLESLGLERPSVSQTEYRPEGDVVGAEEIRALEASLFRRLSTRFTKKTWVSLVSLFLFFFCPWPFSISAPLVVRAGMEVTARALTEGVVEKVFVSEGDTVTAGQSLVRLVGYEADIAKKNAEISRVEAELEKLKRGATSAEVNEYQKMVALAQEVTAQAKEKAERSRKLFAQDLISNQQFEEARSDHEIKQKELEKALAQLSLVRGGTRPELIRAKKAELEGLVVDLNLLKSLQSFREIRAPVNGVVVTPRPHELIGQRVQPGDAILSVADISQLLIEATVKEWDITYLQPGQTFHFKIQAMPERTLEGTLTRIAPIGELSQQLTSLEASSSFRIYSSFKNEKLLLRPGMTGVGQVKIGMRTIGILALRRAVRNVRVSYGF